MDDTIKTLDDLLAVLRADDHDMRMDELPTFGGTEPADTQGVWSWDERRLLVGTCPDDYEIVNRNA